MNERRYSRKEGGEIRSIDGLFKPLANSHVTEKLVKEVEYNESLLPKGLHSKAKKDKFYQGFPTLKTIAHTVLIRGYNQVRKLRSLIFY